MKKIILVVLAVVFVALSGFAIYKGFNYQEFYIPTIEEFEADINTNVDLNRLGLFYYQGNQAVSVREDNLDIDKNKPIVIYSHGMLDGNGYRIVYNFGERNLWQDAGYNVFVFRWAQFANTMDTISMENKQWSGGEHMIFSYDNQQGEKVVETNNLPQYSLAEIFGIYYNEMMTKYDMQSDEIRFLGHSMGGQLSMAISSYIKTMTDKGIISKRYMLTRITMLDPYLSSLSNDTKVKWLDRNIVTNAEISLDTIKELRENGIPVEYILSGLALFSLDEDHLKRFKEETVCIVVESSYLEGGIIDVFAKMHQVAIDWYNLSLNTTLMDKTTDNTTIALSAATPTTYTAALYGSLFNMEKNITKDTSDDALYSTKREKGVVCGFVFNDKNKNGINDDTYANKRKGIKIQLFCQGEKIQTVRSSAGGFYRFDLDEEYIGKELYIKVSSIKPTIVAQGEGRHVFDGNSINSNKESSKFVLDSNRDIRIINCGII